MPVDQEEIIFENLIITMIGNFETYNLWGKIYKLKLPSYLKNNIDRFDITMRYIEKHLHPKIGLKIYELEGNIYFTLHKQEK